MPTPATYSMTALLVAPHALATHGFTRLMASAGIRGETRIPARRSTPLARTVSVVIVDCGVGLDEARRVMARAERRSVPALAYADAGEPTHPLVANTMLGLGAVGVVSKNAPPSTFVEAVAAAGARRALPEAAGVEKPDLRARLDVGLSARESEVLSAYAHGATARQVAVELGISQHSVTTYLQRIRAKYDAAERPAPRRIDLYTRALEDGLIEPRG